MQVTFESPDQPDVHALIAELDDYLYSLYPPENVYALDIASLLAPNVMFAVARDPAGAPLGCAAVVVTPEYGEIKRMYVRPAARGKGLARRLISTLEDAAAARGCSVFMLETGPTMPEALALYERMGTGIAGLLGSIRKIRCLSLCRRNWRELAAARSFCFHVHGRHAGRVAGPYAGIRGGARLAAVSYAKEPGHGAVR